MPSLFEFNDREWSKAVDAWAKYGERFGERGTPCISYWSVRLKAAWAKREIGEVWKVAVTDGDMTIRQGRLHFPAKITLTYQKVNAYVVAQLAYPAGV